MTTLQLHLNNETATLAFGAHLAAVCTPPCLIFLHGELGSGKTTLVRGFLQGLGYSGKVKSPTYTLVEPYTFANKLIFHFDLYRLNDPEELLHLGIADYFASASINLIEWPERAKNQLPKADLTCYIHVTDLGRDLTVTAESECGRQLLQQLVDQIK